MNLGDRGLTGTKQPGSWTPLKQHEWVMLGHMRFTELHMEGLFNISIEWMKLRWVLAYPWVLWWPVDEVIASPTDPSRWVLKLGLVGGEIRPVTLPSWKRTAREKQTNECDKAVRHKQYNITAKREIIDRHYTTSKTPFSPRLSQIRLGLFYTTSKTPFPPGLCYVRLGWFYATSKRPFSPTFIDLLTW